MIVYVPFVLLVVAAVATGFAVATETRAHESRRRVGLGSTLDLALVASVAAILSLTLVPMDAAEQDVRLVPLRDIVEASTPPVDTKLLAETVLNVVLFLPFGAALGARGLSIGTTVLAAFVLSVAVELAQWLVVSGRTTSVDDLLQNTLGALLGHVILSAWTAATAGADSFDES